MANCSCREAKTFVPLVSPVDARTAALAATYLEQILDTKVKNTAISMGATLLLPPLPFLMAGGLSILAAGIAVMSPVALVFGAGYYFCEKPRDRHRERANYLAAEALAATPAASDPAILDYISAKWSDYDYYTCPMHDYSYD